MNGNMNNILNTKLLELLSGLDKSKVEQATRLVNNMSKEDLNSLMGILNKNANKDSSNTPNNSDKTK